MTNYDIQAEAEAVIAALYPPRWTDAGLRRLMIASWEEARRTHLVKREDLRP